MSLYTIWSIFVYFILIGSSVLIVEEIKFLSVFFSLFSKILFLYVFFKALFHFSFSKFDILIFIFLFYYFLLPELFYLSEFYLTINISGRYMDK